MFGGEALTYQDAELWRRVAPLSRIHNAYGPTELALCVANHLMPEDSAAWTPTSNGTVPIGTIYPRLEGVLLDEDGRAADEGEFCVRGPQRFEGYLDPRENAGRFVEYEQGGTAVVYDCTTELTDRHWYRTGDRVRWENGAMVHCGRIDQQVKLQGHRIEIGEVETILRRRPGVIDAAVVVIEQDGEARLAAAYAGLEIAAADFDMWLRERLPLPMVPVRIVHLDGLPLNENGKTDRRELARVLGEGEGS